MAKTAMKVKQQRKQKFSTREYNRCRICGRPHAYLRKYGIFLPPAGSSSLPCSVWLWQDHTARIPFQDDTKAPHLHIYRL